MTFEKKTNRKEANNAIRMNMSKYFVKASGYRRPSINIKPHLQQKQHSDGFH